ncbi:hypothetical protein BBO99_00004527 [Phytophthora kernoviae]|uniref:Borealin N-terminal domain-containing protein n=2 Tax=Phytophthora kernoviae TaxID=325452 RepID=A0A3R7II94_9STRA|nr:hypothetical protein G195_004958 [Phytophthora kernoviae 00238/432]KAG2521833.1 hypothetical protein JM16_004308 [Phytophthora kernoviae]KAG2523285.1 hypothetical protein JM18_003832 [Phytophthora kernoviae]RLN15174.1 hypothetical protein BBI17_004719 [Phytophthora kernoviae]RLN80408.1 hypothetical protein BBO99_00004527 [Phytophthora kernoviae]
MATSNRRRVGRTLRRPRRRSAANSNGGANTRSTAGTGPLQAIGENTVVELVDDGALSSNASSSRFRRSQRESVAPSPTKESKKKGGTTSQPKKKKKRPRESVATTLVQSQKKRKQQLETLLDELETQVQEQCEELIADAERRAQELEMELKVQLLFLPEAVRQMPWRTFVEDFGGDLQNYSWDVGERDVEWQTADLP